MYGGTIVFTLLSAALVSASVQSGVSKEMEGGVSNTSEQTLYYGGDIITMEDDEATYVEAVIRWRWPFLSRWRGRRN